MPAEDFLKKAAVCRKACWSLFFCAVVLLFVKKDACRYTDWIYLL